MSIKSTLRKGVSALGTQVMPAAGVKLADLIKSSPSKGGGGGYYVDTSASRPSDQELIQGYTDTLYAAYRPEPLVYEERSAEALRAELEAWLRPGYDGAIARRRERTQSYRAALDADAVSRGMGSSSYVTDVKSRQMAEEARDVAALESEYGAALAGALSEQLGAERERALEAAMFNSRNDHDAYMRAYEAALTMFAAYKARGGGRSGYYVSGSGGAAAVPTTPEYCEEFLSILSPEERREVYAGSTAQGQQYKAELMASVSPADYYRLMAKYPAAH
ncbi:MAG: hypothetical protein Q4C13_03140 [Clostridia bacterium]|nr:hypothetical protein [Clostridia bacterium]